MQITRLYTDEIGKSRFADIAVSSVQSEQGVERLFKGLSSRESLFCEVKAGTDTDYFSVV